MLRLWPTYPSKARLATADQQIQKYETKIKYQQETDRRLKEKSERKTLAQRYTKKEKAAILLKNKKR